MCGLCHAIECQKEQRTPQFNVANITLLRKSHIGGN